jgi:hypothetical protein
MGFDGKRKGFVMGGGIGYGAMATLNWNDGQIDEYDRGLGGNFIVGYSWNNKNMLVLELNGTSFDTDYFGDDGTQMFVGPVWYHYFNPSSSSFFTSAGFWRYGYGVRDHTDDKYRTMAGWGFLLGGGYEFTKQLQIGAYYGRGWPKPFSCYDERASNSHINILLTVVAY